MADPRFFSKSEPIPLSKICDIAGCTLADDSVAGTLVDDVAALSQAQESQISFLDNIKYKDDFTTTKAGACIVAADMTSLAPQGTVCLISPSPYKSYALVAQYFYPQNHSGHISPQAFIDDGATIGKGCTVEAGAYIGPRVTIGEGSVIGANAVITHAIIGDHVRIYRGACIGQDGFGFAPDPAGHVKVPQLGRVVIGDHVEIGANTCIDRGAGPDTVIGDGTWIDNLVQIGHNVQIGRGCVIVSQVGISGSTHIDDFTMIGGQAGLAGHLKIGKGVRIAAQSGIMRNIPDGESVMGYPAMPIKQFMKQTALLKRMLKK